MNKIKIKNKDFFFRGGGKLFNIFTLINSIKIKIMEFQLNHCELFSLEVLTFATEFGSRLCVCVGWGGTRIPKF